MTRARARDIGIEFKDKVTGTESLKAHEIFAHVQPLFRESRVLIPEDAKLARELAGLEDRFSKMKSNTPHDDMATACVAALDQAVFVELPSIKPWHFVA